MREMVTIDAGFLASRIKPRPAESHKGNYGKLLIVGGSRGYTGAPVIAARAALRTGAGIVFLSAPECIYQIQASRCVEEVCTPLASDENGLVAKAAEQILSGNVAYDACVVGPGLGSGDGAAEVVYRLIHGFARPLVVDADGINAVSRNIDILRERTGETVLTPHEVEFQRLGGDLSAGREHGAVELAARLGAVVVLKGHRTVTAGPDGSVFVNTTGNPGMATGGSGDALAGVIGSLLGQGLSALDAAVCGVYIHGLAGDIAAAELGEFGMLPSDLIAKLPYTLKQFSSRSYN